LFCKWNFIPHSGLNGGHFDGTTLGTAQQTGHARSDLAGEGDVIQVVSRAFDVLRCFEAMRRGSAIWKFPALRLRDPRCRV